MVKVQIKCIFPAEKKENVLLPTLMQIQKIKNDTELVGKDLRLTSTSWHFNGVNFKLNPFFSVRLTQKIKDKEREKGF